MERGRTTISNPFSNLSRFNLKISRTSRFARFRSTDPPTFLLAATPTRVCGWLLRAIIKVTQGFDLRTPSRYTFSNSPLFRIRFSFLNTAASLKLNGQSAPTLAATLGQYPSPPRSTHSFPKAVGAFFLTGVRLKSALYQSLLSAAIIAGLLISVKGWGAWRAKKKVADN